MGKKAKSREKARKSERRRAELAALELIEPATRATAAEHAIPDSTTGRRGRGIDPTELAARLASLGSVLQRQVSRADAGDGLTRARLSALALLVLGGPRTLGELAAAEGVRPPTMTRLVHAMEADGLIERAANPVDRRSVILRATKRGEKLLEGGRARQIAPLATAIAGLEPRERAALDEAVELLGRVLRDPSRGPAAARS